MEAAGAIVAIAFVPLICVRAWQLFVDLVSDS